MNLKRCYRGIPWRSNYSQSGHLQQSNQALILFQYRGVSYIKHTALTHSSAGTTEFN
jgi:hypothetical protein